jgi:hypothetical protein
MNKNNVVQFPSRVKQPITPKPSKSGLDVNELITKGNSNIVAIRVEENGEYQKGDLIFVDKSRNVVTHFLREVA